MFSTASRSDLLSKWLDPRRDLNQECGYANEISASNFREMFDRELGNRVVSVFPDETWRLMPVIFEEDDADKETEFEHDFEFVNRRHRLLHFLHRADIFSGIGQYGVILWGISDGKNLNEPVDGWEAWEEVVGVSKKEARKVAKKNLLYIRVIDASLVNISGYETNVNSPRYGLPTSYQITLSDPRNPELSASVTPPNSTQTSVHWTRITHVADNRGTSEVLGLPRMQPVWNRLCDLRKVLGGSGEMYWRGGFPGVSLETQSGLENVEIDTESTRAAMFDYMNGLQRYMVLNGLSAKSLAPQIADPASSFEVQIKAICVTLGVPYRVFMGIEEGVVSGDQATNAWAARLKNRQERYVTPCLIEPVLQRLVDYGVLRPPAEPRGWRIEWPDLSAPNEAARADIAVRRTEALAKYVGGGVDTLVPPLEFLTLVCGFPDKTAVAIIEAAVQHIDALSGDETTPPHVHEEPKLEEEPEELNPKMEPEDEKPPQS